jgi:Holliday junction resolvasome RuvABC endonuclease subunit
MKIDEVQALSPFQTSANCAAFDLGTTTGMSLLTSGKVICQRIHFQTAKGRKTLPDDHQGKRFADLFAFCAALFDSNRLDYVFYEEAGAFRNVTSARVPYGMRGVLLAAAAASDIPTLGIHAQTLKKAATGSGRAQKSDMIAAAEDMYPGTAGQINHDQADSLCLLRHGLIEITKAKPVRA